MKRSVLVVCFSVYYAYSYGATCPNGQILRVHLHECVSAHSTLAMAYVGKPIHLPKHKLIPVPIPYIVPIPPANPYTNSDPVNSDTVRMMKAGIIPIPKF